MSDTNDVWCVVCDCPAQYCDHSEAAKILPKLPALNSEELRVLRDSIDLIYRTSDQIGREYTSGKLVNDEKARNNVMDHLEEIAGRLEEVRKIMQEARKKLT